MRTALALFLLAVSCQPNAKVFSSVNFARSVAEAKVVVEAVVVSARRIDDHVVAYEIDVSRVLSGTAPNVLSFCSTEKFAVGTRILFAAKSPSHSEYSCETPHTRYTDDFFAFPVVRDITSHQTPRIALSHKKHRYLGCLSDEVIVLAKSRGSAEHDWPPDWDRAVLFPLLAFKQCAGIPAAES